MDQLGEGGFVVLIRESPSRSPRVFSNRLTRTRTLVAMPHPPGVTLKSLQQWAGASRESEKVYRHPEDPSVKTWRDTRLNYLISRANEPREPPMPADWMPPANTRALIFDCDGTLADTMPIHYRAWMRILAPRGIPFDEIRFYQLGGMPTGKIIRVLSDETGVPVADADIGALIHEKESIFLSLLHEVEPLAGIVGIAERFRGRLPMAVASGGYRDVVRRTLDAIGIRDWFDAMVCAEDTANHKPEPDVFLEAAARLGVISPADCVVFEDTDIGLEAAHRAGMVGVDVRAWAPVRMGANPLSD